LLSEFRLFDLLGDSPAPSHRDALDAMRRELADDRRQMQQQWRQEQQEYRRSLHQQIDDLELKMRAIQDARDQSNDFVDLSAVFERMYGELREDRVVVLREDRPQYTYDPEIKKVRLAYERVNWQKEGF